MAAFTAMMIGLAIASAAMSARNKIKAGQAQQAAGQAQQSASNSEADLADWNASIADQQAADATARGTLEENRFRAGVKGMIGGQRAGLAANGVDVGFGSAVDVQADTAYMGELDALTIRTNAARQAWGFQVQGVDLRARAAIARKTGVFQAAAGDEALSASKWSAAGTLLSTGTSLYASQFGFKGAGGGGGDDGGDDLIVSESASSNFR